MKKENQSTSKFIVVLDKGSKTALKKVENELSIKLTSSKELSSKVRAQDIYNSGNGLYLKNLGLAVIENCEEEHLKRLTNSSNNPIIHWEKERIFTPVSELDIIKDMKVHLDQFSSKIDELELLIKERKEIITQPFIATWGLHAVGAELSKFSGKGIDLCILDTGFFAAHPDFQNRSIEGKSFVQNQAWDFDGHGHGTHCTGTAAGNISLADGQRYGIAYEANIVIGKVLADNGSGSTSGIIDALDNCLEKGYRIVSMSLGSAVGIGEEPSPIFELIGKKALDKNCLIIAAAGNDSKRPNNLPRPVSSPANAESIMSVAAVKESLKVASFSNGGINPSDGGKVDISAPGVNVFSSYSSNAPGNKLYTSMSGTSMATPHVSGIAALYCEAFPNLSARQIWKKLEDLAKPLPNQLLRDVGFGLAQVI